MKHVFIIGYASFFTLVAAACGGTDSAKNAGDDKPVRQTLRASGECSFEACGAVPSSMQSQASVACDASSGADCDWEPFDPDGTVSYRSCDDSECPPRPAIDCPEDTVQASQQCGSENDAACAWTTVCTPPRITTPCPDAKGCDGIPVQQIGIICKDGSAGGFACVTDGERCFLERNCD
jgi:hypothetical protein